MCGCKISNGRVGWVHCEVIKVQVDNGNVDIHSSDSMGIEEKVKCASPSNSHGDRAA